jgi:hypothetical protein
MSDALVVLNNNTAIMSGGVGLGSSIFKARPSFLELVHKSSRQENVVPGEFRVLSTNEHLGKTIRAVLLAVPQPRREWYRDPTVFSKDNKACFSLDGIRPHDRAADPQAMYCAKCPKGDINWNTWRKTKDPKDLPPCGAYWHLLLADRATQTPYYLDIKGTSASPFKQAMETQMSGLLAKLMANVRAENKQRGYSLVTLQNQETGEQFQEFRTTPGFTVPETGQLPILPMPNIFDISFDIYAASKDGGPYVMGFKNFALMKPEDKAEFGQLYLDLMQQRAEAQQVQQNDEAEVDAAVAEAPAQQAKGGEVLPPITI